MAVVSGTGCAQVIVYRKGEVEGHAFCAYKKSIHLFSGCLRLICDRLTEARPFRGISDVSVGE